MGIVLALSLLSLLSFAAGIVLLRLSTPRVDIPDWATRGR